MVIRLMILLSIGIAQRYIEFAVTIGTNRSTNITLDSLKQVVNWNQHLSNG